MGEVFIDKPQWRIDWANMEVPATTCKEPMQNDLLYGFSLTDTPCPNLYERGAWE